MAQKPARKQTKKLATATKEISSYSGTRRHANEVRGAKMSTIHLHTICMGGERLSITVSILPLVSYYFSNLLAVTCHSFDSRTQFPLFLCGGFE